MSLKIREAKLADAAAIQKLNADEMEYDYPLEQTRQKLSVLLKSEKDKIFVAEVDGAVIGYVHASDYELLYAEPMKNIMGIAVSRNCRLIGVGKYLMERVEQWAIETGSSGVRVVSGSSRIDAHSYYLHLGYGQGEVKLKFAKKL